MIQSRWKQWLATVVMMLCMTGMVAVTADAAPKASSVALNKTKLTVDMDDRTSYQLKATVSPRSASQKVKWSTSNSSVATVSSSGKVTFKKAGSVTIKATSVSNSKKYKSCSITVKNTKKPSKLYINGSSLSLTAGKTHKLSYKVSPSSASSSAKFVSSNKAVATVSSSGVITAKKSGTAVITVKSAYKSSAKDTIRVQVKPKSVSVSSVSLSKTSLKVNMAEDKTYQLKAKVSPSSASQSVKWSTSNSSVATVSSSGKVTFKKAGKVTIKATSASNSKKYKSCTITVTNTKKPSKLVLDDSSITLTVGESKTLGYEVSPSSATKSAKFSTSSSSVASVSSTGKITAKKAGSATITVKSAYNSSVKDTVKVKVVSKSSAVTAVNLNTNSLTLDKAKDKSYQLKVAVSPSKYNSKVKWSTSNSKVVTVSSTGKLAVKGTGTAVITVKSTINSKKYDKCTVTVVDERIPSSLTLTKNSVTLDVGESEELEVKISPSTASKSVKYSSSKSSVASVSSSGKITAKASGTAVITVASSYKSSVKDTITVKVVKRPAPKSISIQPATSRLALKKTLQLSVAVTPSDSSKLVTWKSSNSAVAEVSSTGKVTAKKAGDVTIYAYSKRSSKIKGVLKLEVYDPSIPTSLTLSASSLLLGEKDTITLTPTIQPSTASKAVTWTSSNDSVVSVSASGKVTAKKPGTATIKVTTQKGGLSKTVSVTVLDTTKTTTIPARTTTTSGISANLAKIEAIQRSARNQVDNELRLGNISSSEASARKKIIDRAFEMQAFPWMTKEKQDYWNLSLNHKAYMPGKVYYGLPYIQCGRNGNYNNRRYNAAKAVSEGRYIKNGSYYMLNQDRLLNGCYVGNDCSSFVSQSQMGTSHSASYLNTTAIAKSSYYKTVSRNEMRPGDLLVKSGSHTILFLYYTNDAKTQMMCIEQGGNGNTVICSVFNVSSYASYTPKRQVGFRN